MKPLVALAFITFTVSAFTVTLSACPQPLGKVGCENVRDCDTGQRCEDGVCEEVTATSCATDVECGVDEVCNIITTRCEPKGTTGGCQNTAECPLTQFCNTATGLCADLATGFCRTAAQCAAEVPVCSAASENVPGRCVECMTAEDCGGASCVDPGICSDVDCPDNSTPTQDDTCVCNAGFEDNGGVCVPVTTGEGEGEGPGDGDLSCAPGFLGDLFCTTAAPAANFCSPDTSHCVCDIDLLAVSCLLNLQTSDAATCRCV